MQIYAGSILTTAGSLIKTISSMQFFVNLFSLSLNSQFIIALSGQIIAGCAQPFVLFTPTKVAEYWFPENQRALATTISGMANPVGLVLGNLIPPLIVKLPQDITILV